MVSADVADVVDAVDGFPGLSSVSPGSSLGSLRLVRFVQGRTLASLAFGHPQGQRNETLMKKDKQ